MNASLRRQLISFFLILAVFVSCIPAGALADDSLLPAEESIPESIPEESLPEESQPEESQPEESQPEESEPEVSLPEESLPEESLPEESLPEGSQPEESQPEESLPEESLPEESEPTRPQTEETQPQEVPTEESLAEDTLPESAPLPDTCEPAELSENSVPGLYFGQLHAHTAISDGTSTPEAVFQQAAQTEGLDFFAVTDLSDSFDQADQGEIKTDGSTVSSDWAAGKAAAAAVTSSSFVGIFGYEMGWPSQMKIGHISTFGTPGFQSWTQEAYRDYDGALENYYEALSSVSGSVSQFNHPGTQYGTFCEFSYSGAADRAVSLLEINFDDAKPLRYYTKALDLGWHLAPTGSVRTAVYADALTEEEILRALGSCRAYATEDTDLEILYSMDGYPMGSRLDLRDVGERMELSVQIADSTDGAAGLVEVVTTGGKTAAQQQVSEASGLLSFSLPVQSGYYFLRITQPDGDLAVTAPIWVDAEEELGIARLTCETPVPVQKEEVTLDLRLYNEEDADFLVDSLEVLADGFPAAEDSSLTVIPGNSAFSHPLTFSCDSVGLTNITVRLTGSLEGSPRSYKASLPLSFHQSSQVTAILVDAGHGNAGLGELNILKSLAAEENIRLTAAENITAGLLETCRFLLVSAPAQPFSDEFLCAAAEFAGYGGSLVICGQADREDAVGHSAAELNRLLSAVGSTMRIRDDLAQDLVTNGGSSSQLYVDAINTALPWCKDTGSDQVYRHHSGCIVDPGNGSWIVKGRSTTGSADGDGDGLGGESPGSATLLACEELSGGGTVFAAGCLFLNDTCLKEASNIWDAPYANRTIGQQILNIGGETIPLRTIRQAKAGGSNELFRVRGYVTAGTSNPYNSFPDTLYVQDDTGGIAIVPFSGESVQQGTAVEVTGFAGTRSGNRILKVSSWKKLDSAMHQYQAIEGSWDTLLDPAQNGGNLVQVEGKCLEIYCRENDTMAGCLLKDEDGNLAKVAIEDYIFNGSDGENDLHKTIRKGRTVRAAGLLHVNEYGDTVIRARNCEEVVWVPPRTYWNPNTGDDLLPGAIAALAISMTGLFLLRKRKRK